MHDQTTLEAGCAAVSLRLDRLSADVDRIKRRLFLAEVLLSAILCGLIVAIANLLLG